uniref:E3 UBIQUITIN LIGASE RNF4 n=1 Tax=Rattus norvegicus TaxID=10116 RepID=UPI00026E0F27|nr:Chain A, E3 UBIQUITIN LIGASE RNF4 [Rattus norvegicus]5AIT_A Chain A, E3 UBIQUITIN-PROTEIN LIGASE RNF4 [Rattus norvegicus]5AIU_A Chain A, E3 UBIQUITIN-PROTEIN LIGASE RNF4 [Rattus norvegicus]
GAMGSGTVSCPICMDGYSEIVQNGRLIVSTECGHVFCSQCLRDSLKNANTCPTCRKKINHKRYHPIYIGSGTVSCPICMDGYSEIVQNGRLIVSTECGHVFCSQCLRDSLKNANTCPTCRKKINHKRYHPIYI